MRCGFGFCLMACGSPGAGESVGTQQAALLKKFSIGDTVPGPNLDAEYPYSVVDGGDHYLVTWGTAWQWASNDHEAARVTRVSKGGELLDPHGIAVPLTGLSNGPKNYQTLAAFDGTNYRVVVDTGGTAYFMRLAHDGTFLDTTDEQVLKLDRTEALACTNNGTCVTVDDDNSGKNHVISFVRMNQSNLLVDTRGQEPSVTLAVPSANKCDSRLFSAGNQVGALTTCDSAKNRVWLTFFDPANGATSNPVVVSSTNVDVLAAGQPGEALVALNVVVSGVCTQQLERYSTVGEKLDAKPLVLQTHECAVGLTTAGDGYVLTTDDFTSNQVSAHRLLGSGLESGAAFPLGTDSWFVGVAADASSLLYAAGGGSEQYADDYNDEQLYLAPFDSAGVPIKQRFPVVAAVNHMDFPAVAWGGDGFLALWSDTRNGRSPDIYGTRISSAGKVLDEPSIPIVTGKAVVGAALASNGDGFLVAAKYEYDPKSINPPMDVLVTYIDKTGKPSGAITPVSVGVGSYRDLTTGPRVLWDGRRYLVSSLAFGGDFGSENYYDLAGFDAHGNALDLATVDLAALWNKKLPFDARGVPALAATPSTLVTAWYQRTDSGADEVAVAWLDNSGDTPTLLAGPTVLPGTEVDAPSFGETHEVSVACSPNVCAVVSGSRDRTQMQLVDAVGNLKGVTHTLVIPHVHPSISWDGHAFLLTSTETENTAEYYGEDGKLLPSSRLFLNTSGSLTFAAAANDGDGHSLVVTSMGDDSRFTGVLFDRDRETDDAGGAGGDATGGTTSGVAGTGGTGGVVIGGTGGSEAAGSSSAGETTTGGAGSESDGGTAGSLTQGGSQAVIGTVQPAESNGCGCRLTPSSTKGAPFALLAAAALMMQRRRRAGRVRRQPVG